MEPLPIKRSLPAENDALWFLGKIRCQGSKIEVKIIVWIEEAYNH